MSRNVKVAIVGGSGFWSELSHHKHLNAIGADKNVNVSLSAIVDPIDPRSVTHHPNLQSILRRDNPTWIDPKNFTDTDAVAEHLKNALGVNLLIIASTPCTHFEYGMSAIKYRINTICDKPIISHDNASTSLEAAAAIATDYNRLLVSYLEAKKDTPSLLFHSILRRRALNAFVRVAEDLKEVYEETGAGVNGMSIIVNGGKYKFPAELDKPGAHGYLEGVGSMSHSAYHYLDVMAWYLTNAPGSTRYIRPRLNYVFRISDYLKASSYSSLATLIGDTGKALVIPKLSKETLGCELNAGFTFDLLDADENLIGSNSFLFNLVSFSPRTRVYDESVHEPADHAGGGRMSHVLVDVHQDGLQNWQITKNDIVFEDNNIQAVCRRHPLLGKKAFESFTDDNAYSSGVTLEDLLGVVIDSVSEDKSIAEHSNIRSLDEERIAMQLYGQCYSLLARDYSNSIDEPLDVIALQD